MLTQALAPVCYVSVVGTSASSHKDMADDGCLTVHVKSNLSIGCKNPILPIFLLHIFPGNSMVFPPDPPCQLPPQNVITLGVNCLGDLRLLVVCPSSDDPV